MGVRPGGGCVECEAGGVGLELNYSKCEVIVMIQLLLAVSVCHARSPGGQLEFATLLCSPTCGVEGF